MDLPLGSAASLVAEYLDAVARKDHSAVDRFFHPDVEYMVNGCPARDRTNDLPPISDECRDALPWLGIYRGKEALREFLAHMHRNLDVVAYGPRLVLSEGNRAAAFGWFRLHSLATGRSADIGYSILLELRDGLIAKYHFLENTFDVAATFRVGGSWKVETDGAAHDIPVEHDREV
jgi:ketosteroid isomerase-like protein